MRCRLRFVRLLGPEAEEGGPRQHLPPAILARGLHAQHHQQRRVLDCGGKQGATPLWKGSKCWTTPSHRKASSPLRSAGALHNKIRFVARLRARLRREAQPVAREQLRQMMLSFQFRTSRRLAFVASVDASAVSTQMLLPCCGLRADASSATS